MNGYIPIRGELGTNYNDHKFVRNPRIEIATSVSDSTMANQIWLNVYFKEDREDDYLTIGFRIDELLEAIGKSIAESATADED